MNERLSCEICEIEFKSQRNLAKHNTQTNHSKKVTRNGLACRYCKRKLGTWQSLKRHLKTCNNGKYIINTMASSVGAPITFHSIAATATLDSMATTASSLEAPITLHSTAASSSDGVLNKNMIQLFSQKTHKSCNIRNRKPRTDRQQFTAWLHSTFEYTIRRTKRLCRTITNTC